MVDPKGTGDFVLPPPARTTTAALIEAEKANVLADVRTVVPPKGTDSSRKHEPGQDAPVDARDEDASWLAKEWVSMPQPPFPEQTALWHYTDSAGIIGILNSDALRATSTITLNDSAEFQHGRTILLELMREVKASRNVHLFQKGYLQGICDLSTDMARNPGLFVVCASEAADSLAQWRLYGGQQPHALVLERDSRFAVLGPEDIAHQVDTVPSGWGWCRVLYERQDQRKYLSEVLGYIAHTSPARKTTVSAENQEDRSHAILLASALAYCKDPSFSEEREVRIVTRPPRLDAVKFRPGAVGVTPYVELIGVDTPTAHVAVAGSRLPLSRIVVGPFSTRNDSARGVELLLKARHYQLDVAICSSTLR